MHFSGCVNSTVLIQAKFIFFQSKWISFLGFNTGPPMPSAGGGGFPGQPYGQQPPPVAQPYGAAPSGHPYQQPPAQQYGGQPGYQQPSTQGYSQAPQPSHGYQQPPSQGYQQPPSQGYQQPSSQGYQQPSSQGYQQPPSQSYQQPKGPPQSAASQPAPSRPGLYGCPWILDIKFFQHFATYFFPSEIFLKSITFLLLYSSQL